MSLDVPGNMSDVEANYVSKRIGIIDKLITNHGVSINDIFQKGLKIEQNIKLVDPNYSSVLADKIAQFKSLNSSYKH